MSNSILNCNIQISETTFKNQYEGILSINCQENLTIDRILGTIYFEARGRMSSIKKQLLSFNISSKKHITKDEIIKIPFTFQLEESNLETYTGKNVSFFYNFEAKIQVNEEDLEKLDRGIFKRVKSLFTADYSSKFSEYFDKKNTETEYKISEKHQPFTLSFNISNLYLPLGLISSLYILTLIYTTVEFNGFHILFLIIAIILVGNLNFKRNSKKIGKISLKTINDNNSFICLIKPAKNFSLKKSKIHYQIIEKVVDKRGTSSTTNTEIIYKSTIQSLNNKGTSEIRFDFPDNKRLASLEFDEVTIYWEIVITGIHAGTSENLTCIIEAYNI